jgi:hypothetical protein
MPGLARPPILVATLAVALAATPVPVSSAKADTASYPCIVRLVRVVPVAARTYGIETSALASGPFDVLVTLFTRTHSYYLYLPTQTFDKKASALFRWFLAAPTFFTVPDDEPIEAAYAKVPPTSERGITSPCVVSHLVVSDALILQSHGPTPKWPTAAELEA